MSNPEACDAAALVLFTERELVDRRIATTGYPPREACYDNLRDYVLALEKPHVTTVTPPKLGYDLSLLVEVNNALRAMLTRPIEVADWKEDHEQVGLLAVQTHDKVNAFLKTVQT
jgi:hypothetical protein